DIATTKYVWHQKPILGLITFSSFNCPDCKQLTITSNYQSNAIQFRIFDICKRELIINYGRNVFSHALFSNVILNLFQSDFEKWHIFLQKLEDEKLLSENMQLFFTLFNSKSKKFMTVIASSNQWKYFFEDFALKENKIWTKESKILKTVEACLNTENVSDEGMPILLDILWTHFSGTAESTWNIIHCGCNSFIAQSNISICGKKRTSVDWTLWNEVTWEVETKRKDPLISDM
ncbi:hypothetical protein RFI_02638, partial [Reticulomyxa filosa]